MAAAVVSAVVERAGVDPATVEDVILGNATPEGEQGLLMGRLVALRAGFPKEVGGATINRWCGSSMSAIHYAAGQIAMGAGDAFVAAGVESMTRVPMGGFNPMPNAQLMADVHGVYMGMGETAEVVAERYQLSREAQEAFAVESHRKAAAAHEAGKLRDEIVTVDGVDADGCIRPDTNMEGLSGLKPAFSATGSVTAGTSSPLTDGAAATLVCSAEYAREHNLTPLAVIRSMAINGCDPDVMGLGPIGATRKALKRAGLEMGDIDIVELNEAFASQSIACITISGWIWSASTSTAAPSPLATRWVRPVRGSPARPQPCSSVRARSTRCPRSASAAVRASPPSWKPPEHRPDRKADRND